MTMVAYNVWFSNIVLTDWRWGFILGLIKHLHGWQSTYFYIFIYKGYIFLTKMNQAGNGVNHEPTPGRPLHHEDFIEWFRKIIIFNLKQMNNSIYYYISYNKFFFYVYWHVRRWSVSGVFCPLWLFINLITCWVLRRHSCLYF